MVALCACGEPDAIPTEDLILRQLAAGNATPLSTHALKERAEAWRPWRGYAAWHLWAQAEENSSRESLAIAARSTRAPAVVCSD